MSFIEDVKYWFGTQKLRIVSQKKISYSETVLTVKSFANLGIVLTLKREKDIEHATKILEQFKQIKKFNVKVLGICIAESESIKSKCPDLPHWDIINKAEDFEWYSLPKLDRVRYFTSHNYDFLICINPSNHIAADYIIAKSSSPVKLGVLSPKSHTIYNVMIPSKGENATTEELIKDIIEFLKKIP